MEELVSYCESHDELLAPDDPPFKHLSCSMSGMVYWMVKVKKQGGL